MENLELLVNFFLKTERQGPGGESETKRAIDLTGISQAKNLKIADIGCGTGASTLVLAKVLDASITAVDLFPEFLGVLKEKTTIQEMGNRISTLEASMENLPFENQDFDVLWSEGAIYNMGFQRGVREWRNYLKTNGILAVSEVTWLTDSRPKEIQQYWQNEYPEISTASEKIRVLEQNGYSPLGYFPLSRTCWIENFYESVQDRFSSFLEEQGNSETALQLVTSQREEIRMYEQFQNYFSYGLYVAKKSSN